MKQSQMSDLAQTEANALGAGIAGLKDRLVQNPVVSFIAGSGLIWALIGKRKPVAAKQQEVQRWEDEGGAVTPPEFIPTPVHETTLMEAIGPGIGAFALGIVAATLLPRTKSENKTMGPTGGALRNHAGLMGDAAVAVLGIAVRQAGAEVLSQWERSFHEMLDGMAPKKEAADKPDQTTP